MLQNTVLACVLVNIVTLDLEGFVDTGIFKRKVKVSPEVWQK